jgi:hypothetical protein
MRLACLAGFSVVVLSGTARADTCVRPTDPGGYAGYAYGPAATQSFDGTQVRVWYTKEGAHAVRADTTRTDGVPNDVARVAEIGDAALARYAAMGYRAPPSDVAMPECGSNGGDGRIDIYLVDFQSADGQTVPERCTTAGAATTCASFLLVKADFTGLYATRDEGIRTVVPHELFHAVQHAYDVAIDSFWSEGTAQWAAKTLDPTLLDLERFLPAYFKATTRAFDAPAGVAGAYLYGTAIWPVFLDARFGPEIVRSILESMGASGASALDATKTVLAGKGTSLGAEYTRFATWNVATGSRSASHPAIDYGYAGAASYPLVTTTPLSGSVAGALSGLGSAFYTAHADAVTEATVIADASRIAAVLVPLASGRADLANARPLPTTFSGDAVVFVAGLTTNKSDAPYTVSTRLLPSEPDAGSPMPGPSPSETVPPRTGSGTGESTSGCTVVPRGEPGQAGAWVALAALTWCARRVRRAVSRATAHRSRRHPR